MAPRVPRASGNNYMYYSLIGLAIIIIFMLGFLIYIMMMKSNNSKCETQIIHVPSAPNPVIPVIDINDRREDIPVYPKKLPQYDNTQYQQVGILTAEEADKEPIVLPLFAKKLRNRSERWQYYTATDKNNMMRLPIVHQNMKCDEDIGCQEIYDGDKLTIAIYQGRTFTATIYKVDAPKYFADEY